MSTQSRFKTMNHLAFACLITVSSVSLVGCQTAGVNMDGMLSAGMGLVSAANISDEDMKQIGNNSIAELDSSNSVAPANSAYAKRLARLAAPWSEVDGYSLEYKVYLDPTVNAFAVPNGSIRFYSGLLDEMTDDEVRYVIAHEIGHVVLGHSKGRFQTAIMASSARQAIAASGNSTAAALTSSQLGELGEKLVNAQYSQRNENEADDFALNLMTQYGFNPRASVTALRKLEVKFGNQSNLFSSHPAPGVRAERLDSQIANR